MKKLDITKKISIALMALITVVSVAGCNGDTQKEEKGTENPSASAIVTDVTTENPQITEVPTAQPTEAPVITAASFNPETISQGEKLSVFTVSEVKTENGVKTVVFSGILTINGLLSDNGDGTCSFKYTEEYAPYLPTPVGAQKKGFINIDANSALEFLGAKEGAFSITVKDYTLTIVSGEITESVTEYEKQESDYGIIS
jgi:hypothetical protein